MTPKTSEDWHLLVRILFFVKILPHLILMKLNGIGISSDELIHVQAIDCLRSLYPLLFSVDEDSFIFLPPSLLFSFFSRSKFAFAFLFCHRNIVALIFIIALYIKGVSFSIIIQFHFSLSPSLSGVFRL